MFDGLEADILILQETKINNNVLDEDMVLIPGWDCYFSLPKNKKGESSFSQQHGHRTNSSAKQDTLASQSMSAQVYVRPFGLRRESQAYFVRPRARSASSSFPKSSR